MRDDKKDSLSDLGSQEINLLPDEMRSAEERDKRSRTNDVSYQLRAPKKLKKRRRSFAWVPFFGRIRWGVDKTGAEAKSASADVDKMSEALIIETDEAPGAAGEPAYDSERQDSRSIQPILDRPGVTAPSVSPGIRRSFKKGVTFAGFSWLFGSRASRKKGMQQQPIVVPRSQKPLAPPRHYSLLNDEFGGAQRDMVQPPSIGPLKAGQQTSIDLEAGPIQTLPVTPVTPGAQTPKLRRGIRWPRWLDIFYVLGLLASGRHETRPPRIKKEKKHHEASIDAIEKEATPKIMPSIPSRPDIRSIAPERSGSGSEIRTIPQRPITPETTGRAVTERVRKPHRFPRWLDIFSWFSFLGRKKIKVKHASAIPAPRESLIRWGEADHKPEFVVPKSTPPVVPITPVPETPALPTRTSGTMSASIARPVTPAVVSIPPLPNVPQPPRPVPISDDITPHPQEPEGKKKRIKKGALSGLSFHIPKKFTFSDAAKEAREANLIPLEISMRSWKKLGWLMGMTVVATAGLIALVYGGLSVWQSSIERRTDEIDAQINTFKNDILVYKKSEPEMTTLVNQIALINQMLRKHIYWTNFLALLEKYTLPDVYYDGVSATTNGTLSLSAHGTNFETVSQVLALLQSDKAKEFVTKASITGAQQVEAFGGHKQVNFSIDLTLNPNLFYYNDAGSN